MQCDDPTPWHEMIIDRLGDELSEEEAVALEQHLADCPACMAEAELLAGIHGALPPAEPWTPDPDREARLIAEMHALRGSAASRPQPRREPAAAGDRRRHPHPRSPWIAWFARPLPSYAAAALVMIAALGGFLGGRMDAADLTQGGLSSVAAPPLVADTLATNGRLRDPATSTLRPSAVFAEATSDAPLRMMEIGFVPVASDAVGLPGSVLADSL